MTTTNLNNQLDNLEKEVSLYFNHLLTQKEEFIIFDKKDLVDGTPDNYLEMRNDFTGEVYDVQALSINKNGIEVVDASGSNNIFLIRLQDLACVQNRIALCVLMEDEINY
jgi:hypothetical protein